MNDSKITVSLEEVNSAQVDIELHKQDVANRMAQHQETIRHNFAKSETLTETKSTFFRKSMVYMALFGFLFSFFAWYTGETIQSAKTNHPFFVARDLIKFVLKEQPNISKKQLVAILSEIKKRNPELKDNEYLPEKLLNMNDKELEKTKQDAMFTYRILSILWYIILGAIISIGLAIAEPCVSRNTSLIIKNALTGSGLGALGGFIISLFINNIYNALGGGQNDTSLSLQQIFARAVGWGLLGTFMAIAPGIVMKSKKRFILGMIGGTIGGFIGGILFDPICNIFDSVQFARFVNIVGLGIGAAIATVFLENIAKQGWLKVASGLIAGKQFILYRNPTIIGSSPKSEIYLFKDPQIMGKHAAINNHNGDFILTAIDNSTVFVNNQPIRQQRLTSGDRIKIGNTVFIFEAKTLKKAPQTP